MILTRIYKCMYNMDRRKQRKSTVIGFYRDGQPVAMHISSDIGAASGRLCFALILCIFEN